MLFGPQLQQIDVGHCAPKAIFQHRKSRFLSPGLCRHPLAIILILLAIRLAVAPFIVLIPEEAYYWMYSKHPAFGYLDHPPAVAWVISAGTFLFGHNEFAIRISTWIFTLGSTRLCYKLAAAWFNRRTGLVAALIFSIAPSLCGTGVFTTPDPALLFFWLTALFAVTRAYRDNSTAFWLLAGAASGCAFLSKYTALFLPVGTFLFLLSSPRGRKMLASPGPWLALLTALLCASPTLIWNARHNWASFTFQFDRRLDQHTGIRPLNTLSWLNTQFWFTTPPIFALLVWSALCAFRRLRRDTNAHFRFALCFSLPILAVCAWHGLFSGIHMNWPLPAYLSLLPLAAQLGHVLTRRIARAYSAPAIVHALPRFVVILAFIDALLLTCAALRPPHIPLPYPISPWHQIAAVVETSQQSFEQKTHRDPFVLADGKYELASELCFYMSTPQNHDWRDVIPLSAALGRSLSFLYWLNPDQLLGRDALYVSSERSPLKYAGLRAAFDRVDEPQKVLTHPLGFNRTQIFWVTACHNFRGLSDTATLAAKTQDQSPSAVSGGFSPLARP